MAHFRRPPEAASGPLAREYAYGVFDRDGCQAGRRRLSELAASVECMHDAEGPIRTEAATVTRVDDAENVSLADALVVSSVLNDWTYDDFNRILGNLATATPPGGRLLLIELVLPPDGVAEDVGDTDPLLVAALGGRGHTAAEWTSVLAANGFRLERIRPGTPPFSFLEAVRHDAAV